MKLIIFLLTLLSFHNYFAQTPDYFGNNQTWICTERIDGLLPAGCYMNYEYKYHLLGDTTIGSYTYKKVYKKGWSNEAGQCISERYYFDLLTFSLRQDGRKVYIYEYGQDSLFVDYDLNIGDTMAPCYLMPNPSNYGYDNLIVQSIDSVLLNTGYHRRLHFNFYGNFMDTIPYYLIEGVGIFSDNGMSGFDNMEIIISEPFEWFITMDCYLQDGMVEMGTSNCDPSRFDFNLGIPEFESKDKTLIKVCDLMGREIKLSQIDRQILIYYYSDGSIEKRYSYE